MTADVNADVWKADSGRAGAGDRDARILESRVADPTRKPATRRGRVAQSVRELAYASSVYRLMLRGRLAKPTLCPLDIWPGDPDNANAMFQGTFRAAGEEVVAPNASPWTVLPPSATWLAELNCFDWLRDFRAAGGRAATQRARDLTVDWIETHATWSRLAWRPDVLARRVQAWVSHADFLTVEAPPGFAPRFHESLQIQLKHLLRAVTHAPAGAPKIAALVGLAGAEIAYQHRARPRNKALRWLDDELEKQILADGGHCERNPMIQHHLLRALVGLRAALQDAELEPSVPLQTAIDRMAPMLRFFRHGDGALALFNGGLEDRRDDIDATLAAANARGRPHVSASHSGYERFSAGRTLMLMDVGGPPSGGTNDRAHAGCLAFEVSHGSERLIVNCGTSLDQNGDWHRSMRATAAHSAVTIADTNSAQLKKDGTIGRRPVDVIVARREDELGNHVVETSHDGYAAALGYRHHRRLIVDPAGEGVAGEDWLTASDGNPRRAQEQRFTARFHLHPSVSASPQQGGGAILLRSGKGMGWLFQASGGDLGLEESAYLGDGHPRRTNQIVLSAPISAQAILTWALQRVAD